MEPKPDFLGPELASTFQAESVVEAYQQRPPYPDALFPYIAGLIPDAISRAVLDVGAGLGNVARPLAPYVDRVDAVDWSAAMLALGKRLPGGDDPRIRWIQGRIEDVALDPPYGLVSAGASLHWLDWDVALPRFAAALEPGAFLAILHREERESPWRSSLRTLYPRYSTARRWREFDLIEMLEARGLFQKAGKWRTEQTAFTQSVEDYIEGQHSMSSLARERMTPEAAAAFDNEARAILMTYVDADGQLTFEVVGTVEWGTPLAP